MQWSTMLHVLWAYEYSHLHNPVRPILSRQNLKMTKLLQGIHFEVQFEPVVVWRSSMEVCLGHVVFHHADDEMLPASKYQMKVLTEALSLSVFQPCIMMFSTQHSW